MSEELEALRAEVEAARGAARTAERALWSARDAYRASMKRLQAAMAEEVGWVEGCQVTAVFASGERERCFAGRAVLVDGDVLEFEVFGVRADGHPRSQPWFRRAVGFELGWGGE